MGTKINTRKIMQTAIDQHKEFKRGNLSALETNGHYAPNGRLPQKYADQIKEHNSLYIVYSYATPIGWCEHGQFDAKWTIPDVTYSITTTHHQSLLRVMVDNPGFYLKF